jgi:GMP synthase (glutamine-hydrolysing)
MVTDRHDWSERSAEWLRDAAHAGLPLFGICYGHQLIAHALGGEVGYNPTGREMGTIDLELHPPARPIPCSPACPGSSPRRRRTCSRCCARRRMRPVLARSTLDDCHAFRWRDHVWGVQFHPEFSSTHMRGYVRARHDALAREGRCAHQVSRNVTAAPHARSILRRFVRHARQLHGGRAGKP